jgi:co-chaperonin GroES (HSP10)
MTIKLQYGSVLVKADEKIKESKGGVIFAETSQKEPTSGTIIDIAKVIAGNDLAKAPFSKGDHIHYVDNPGYDIEIDGEEFILMGVDKIIYGEGK